MRGLTKAQLSLVAACIEHNASWTTAEGSENHRLLKHLERIGWAEEVKDNPFMMPSYRFTEAGRRALSEDKT